MTCLKHFRLSVVIPLTIGLTSVVIMTPPGMAEGNIDTTSCPASGSVNDLNDVGSCVTTPERFELTVYGMGLCTIDPLPGGDYSEFDNSSCIETLNAPSGQKADLANGATVNLTAGTSTRPPNGTYTHSYIKIRNVVGMRGSYKTNDPINGGTFYSTSGLEDGDSIPSRTPPSENFDSRVTAIGNTRGENCGGTATWTGANGVMKALLSCTDVYSKKARLIVVYKPDSPLVIDNDTNGLKAKFLIENLGLGIGIDINGQPDSFGSAPFRASLETF